MCGFVHPGGKDWWWSAPAHHWTINACVHLYRYNMPYQRRSPNHPLPSSDPFDRTSVTCADSGAPDLVTQCNASWSDVTAGVNKISGTIINRALPMQCHSVCSTSFYRALPFSEQLLLQYRRIISLWSIKSKRAASWLNYTPFCLQPPRDSAVDRSCLKAVQIFLRTVFFDRFRNSFK